MVNCNYKVKITDIQNKYRFKIFCAGSDLSDYYTKSETDTLLNTKANTTDIPDVSNFITKDVNNLTNYTPTSDLNTLLAGKQNTLTFDTKPNENSTNPVTSDGIYKSQKEQNEIISELEEKLEIYKMVENALPKITGSGTELTLDNTANAGMKMSLSPSELSQDGEPTPDNPQEVHTISGSNTITIVGRNYFNYDYAKEYSNTTLNSYRFIEIKYTKPNTRYSIYNYTTIDSSKFANVFLANDNSYSGISFRNLTQYDYGEITTNASGKLYLCTYLATWTEALWEEFIEYFKDAMVVEGTDKTYSYEPYQKQTQDIDLGERENCKIGNYEDKFIRSTNGTWQFEQNIGKVVLDGSENIETLGQYNNNYAYAIVLTGLINTGSYHNLGLLDHFHPTTSPNVSTDGSFYFTAGRVVLFFANITTVPDVKSWFGTHNTTVYYVLARPSYTSIIGILAEQLENVYQKLLSYEGQTNISQVNNDLPFVLNVSALKDLSTL